MPMIHRAATRPHSLPALPARRTCLALLCALTFLATGCDEETRSRTTSTPSATTLATSASSTESAASSASGHGGGGPPAAAGSASTSADASATSLTDGPPQPSATAQAPPTKPTAAPKPTAEPSVAPTASLQSPTPAPTAVATLTPTALPQVDPGTLPPPAPGSADEMAAQVDEIYQPIQRFHAKFEQLYRAKVAGVTKRSSGHLFVEKPAKLSMRYDPPNNNRVVSNGSIVKVYEADNKQMFTQPVARTEYPGALAFIMGKGLRASFTFTFHDRAKFPGGKVLLGTPRVRNPAYERAFFYIDRGLLDQKDPRCMRRVLVLDVQKNRNRFDFTDISQPKSIPAGEFTFTAPPGTTLVK